MDSKIKLKDNLISSSLWIILVLELIILAYFVKFDGNEGWYSLYPSMVLEGKYPYKDFFYHRFPLLPYISIPALYFPFSKLFSFRLLNVLFTLFSYFLIRKVIIKKTNSNWAKHFFLVLAIFSIYPNSFFITAQSYAPFAMFISIGIWYVLKFSSKKGKLINPILAGFFFNLALALRFGPDPLIFSITSFSLICIYLQFEKEKFITFLLSFYFFKVIVILLCLAIDRDSFIWSVYVWPFKSLQYMEENGVTFALSGLKNIVKIKLLFIINFFKNYIPIILILFSGLSLSRFLSVKFIKSIKVSKSNFFLIFAMNIVIIDYLFFLLPMSSGIMQLTYVYPLFCLLSSILFITNYEKCKNLLNKNFIILYCLFLLPLGFISDFKLSASSSHPGSDISILGKLGDELKKINLKNSKIITLSPILATESQSKLYAGLEFEAYGFFPKWDKKTCKKYELLNFEMFIEALNSKQVGLLIVTNRLMKDNQGLGKIFIPYRETIKKEIDKNFRLIKTFGYEDNVAIGPVDIYERIKSNSYSHNNFENK